MRWLIDGAISHDYSHVKLIANSPYTRTRIVCVVNDCKKIDSCAACSYFIDIGIILERSIDCKYT